MLTTHRVPYRQQTVKHLKCLAVLSICVIAAAGCKMGSVGQALSGVPSQSEPPVKSFDQPVVEKSSPGKDRVARALEEDSPDDGFGFE